MLTFLNFEEVSAKNEIVYLKKRLRKKYKG